MYFYATRLALPLLRFLSAETAHRLTIQVLKAGFAPRTAPTDDPILATSLFGIDFANPIGLAAGFDKNADVMAPMHRWGFGFVEVGTVTPKPQSGNPLPRLFRLREDRAVINRMGFNNDGLSAAAAKLAVAKRLRPIGINLGKNRDAADAVADYCQGVATMTPYADYLVINVSSPNTPGLRDLQKRSEVSQLIDAVANARDAVRGTRTPPLLLKIAPDLSERELSDIADVALSSRIDGVIISNTTVARPASLKSPHAPEPGGLSGKPLLEASTRLLAHFYQMTDGKVPLVGVGGIASGADAYAKILAGASLVQLYSALAFEGPGLIHEIKRDLAACLRRDGFKTLKEAVGAGRGKVVFVG